MCFNGRWCIWWKHSENNERLLNVWIYRATNGSAALSTPRWNEEPLYGFLEYEHHAHKTWLSCKGKMNDIIKFYICHNCLFRLLVFFFLVYHFFFKSQRIFYPLCLSVNSKVTYLTFTSCWEAMAANSPSALTNLTLTPVRSPISVWVTRTCVSVVSVV